jgi:hypothetical protein
MFFEVTFCHGKIELMPGDGVISVSSRPVHPKGTKWSN